MQDKLFRLAYLSTNVIVGDDAQLKAKVDEILNVARERNRAAQLTGALLYNSAFFAQVLEGDHDAVADTYERILLDRRHRNIEVLDFKNVDNRIFGNWAMGYVGVKTNASRRFDQATLNKDALAKLDADQILKILHEHMTAAESVDAPA